MGCTAYWRGKTDTRLSGLPPARPSTAHLPSGSHGQQRGAPVRPLRPHGCSVPGRRPTAARPVAVPRSATSGPADTGATDGRYERAPPTRSHRPQPHVGPAPPRGPARPILPRPSRPGGAAGMAADGWRDDEELPVYLARPGTAAVPRQKRGGLFCNVEGAFESKTLDFGALRVGQRRAPPPVRPGPDPPPGTVPGPGPATGDVRASSGQEQLQDPAPADDTVGAGGGAGPGPGRRGAVSGGGVGPRWVRPLSPPGPALKETLSVLRWLLRPGCPQRPPPPPSATPVRGAPPAQREMSAVWPRHR